MGLFDDLFQKASELTGMGQDAVDAASQATEDVTAQVQDQVQGVTEQLPTDPQDAANQIFGDNNQDQQ